MEEGMSDVTFQIISQHAKLFGVRRVWTQECT